ncbi:MAG: YncE family protein [Deinococcus sp.]|nr:YncE family protein [Deinococcus sp.]
MKRLWVLLAILAATTAGALYWASQYFSRQKQPILAVVDYTSTSGEADGVALVDLNPRSATFGQILQKMPIGPGVSPHHLYYNRDRSKLYTTALGGERLYRIWLQEDRIARATPINTGACLVGEDLYFSEDGSKFYLTCMGSSTVMIFDAHTDTLLDQIQAPAPEVPYIKHPHGISVNERLDRMIVTETISPALDDPGTNVTVIEFSTGQVLSTHPVARAEARPSAPVEVLFLPGQPIAYVTAMLDAALWKITWNDQTVALAMVDDGTPRGHSWPLEMYIGPDGHLYVSFAQPGVVNVYSLQDPHSPRLVRTLPADAGAHHIAFSADRQLMFVQNNLLNLDGMNAGTLTVVDLSSGRKIATVDAFVEQGLQPASLELLGEPTRPL